MLIQERIKLIIKANNLNSSEFADKIGINRSNLSHVLSGRNKPGLDFLEKIVLHFPNVNAAWLLTGDVQGEKEEVTKIMDDRLLNVQEANYSKEKSSVPSLTKELSKVLFIYSDGTFDSYLPNR